MAERSFTVDIVTPERVVLSDVAVALTAPGVLGSFGVLPNHAPLLAELEIGELNYRRESGEVIRLAISSGFFQVFNNRITVLADAAERTEEIDVERARQSRDQARESLRVAQGTFDEELRAQCEAALERANNRLRVASAP